MYFLEVPFKGEKAGPSPFLPSCYWEGRSDNWSSSCRLGSQRTSHTLGMTKPSCSSELYTSGSISHETEIDFCLVEVTVVGVSCCSSLT